MAAHSDAQSGVAGLVAKVDRFQQRHAVLGLPFAVVKKFGEDQGGKLAALVAYYGFLSLFPLLLVLVAVLGFVLNGRPDLQQDVLDSTFAQFPVLGTELRDNVGQVSGSGLALAIGLVAALWAGLGAMSACQDACNEIWNIPFHERPPFLKGRLRSLLGLLVLGVLLVATTALAGVGVGASSLGLAGKVLIGVASVVANSLVFLLAFQVFTAHHQPWRTLIPGAVLAGVGYYVLQLGGTWYLQRVVAGAADTYGAFAAVIGLLAWLFLLAQVATYAAELNVVVAHRLWPRSLRADALQPSDERALAGLARRQQRVPHESVAVAFHPPGEPSGRAFEEPTGEWAEGPAPTPADGSSTRPPTSHDAPARR